MSDIAIRAESLGKQYDLWARARPTNVTELVGLGKSTLARWLHLPGSRPTRRQLWALRDVSFEVEQGTVLGLIGPNGAGKSTLLSVLARITEPTEGRAEIRGRVSSLLEVGTGFHPELTGRDNIFLNGAVLGMRRGETAKKFDEIVEFSGVSEFIDTPVKRYSTGMYMRLAFSVAAHLDPDVLLVDEVLSVGDQAFQTKCLERIQEITTSGSTVVFVSHSLGSVAQLCQTGLLITGGRTVFYGPVDEAIEHYLGSRVLLPGGGRLEGVERDGTGRLRLAELTIHGASPDGAVIANQPVRIRARIGSAEPLNGLNVNLHLTVSSPASGDLVTLSTRFDATQQLQTTALEDGTTIDCLVEELPLKPGVYFLSFALERLGEVLDRAGHQIEFTVLPSDFHGTDTVLPESMGPVLVRHTWRIDEADSP